MEQQFDLEQKSLIEQRLRKQTQEFFENLSQTPIYKSFLSKNSQFGKESSHIEGRIHSLAYYLISEIIGFKLRKPTTNFSDQIQSVLLASLPQEKKNPIQTATQWITEDCVKYAPEFYKLCL